MWYIYGNLVFIYGHICVCVCATRVCVFWRKESVKDLSFYVRDREQKLNFSQRFDNDSKFSSYNFKEPMTAANMHSCYLCYSTSFSTIVHCWLTSLHHGARLLWVVLSKRPSRADQTSSTHSPPAATTAANARSFWQQQFWTTSCSQ